MKIKKKRLKQLLERERQFYLLSKTRMIVTTNIENKSGTKVTTILSDQDFGMLYAHANVQSNGQQNMFSFDGVTGAIDLKTTASLDIIIKTPPQIRSTEYVEFWSVPT